MKGFDKRNLTGETAKLMRISTLQRWRDFKRHTINNKDELLDVLLCKLFDAVSALSNPFPVNLMYHFPCWPDYVSNLQFYLKEAMHLQIMNYSELKKMLFKQADQIIFVELEIKPLQSPLHEYRQIEREYVFDLKFRSS